MSCRSGSIGQVDCRARSLAALVGTALVVLVAAAPGAAAEARSGADQPQSGTGRALAPGVERTIGPETEVAESFSRHDLVEVLAADPTYDWAKDVRFEHDIWALEFSFKPVRFVEMTVADSEGRPRKKLVWYMVYRVRNTSGRAVPFYPVFELVSDDTGKMYTDRIVPRAISLVERREQPPEALLDTVQIAGTLEPTPDGDDGSWGLVTWEGIDPDTDAFTIYVRGLTNAYRWEDLADGQRKFERKTLEINFWRPGDRYFEHEGEIRVGHPDKVDYRWVYR